VVPATAHLVRVDENIADRWYIEACINAATRSPGARNSTAMPRLQMSKIEIPVLSIGEQRRIGELVRRLRDEHKVRTRQLEATAHLLQIVENAVGAGAITVQQ
jgi:hypothetical protein